MLVKSLEAARWVRVLLSRLVVTNGDGSFVPLSDSLNRVNRYNIKKIYEILFVGEN